MVPKRDPRSTDPSDWRPISNLESLSKVGLELLRGSVVDFLAHPLPSSPSGERHDRLQLCFCTKDVIMDGIALGGGPELLVRVLQLQFDLTRALTGGLMIVALDLSNAFGSIPLEYLLPGLLAYGVERSAVAFLAYVFTEGAGILGHAIFDILVGISQGAPPLPVVFPLIQGIPLIASEPGRYGGLVLTMQDDSIAIFRFSDFLVMQESCILR